jgi:hypothetical protein
MGVAVDTDGGQSPPSADGEKVSASWLILERLTDLKEEITAVRAEQAAFRDAVERRFEAIDRRFEAVDRRFESMERRFEAMERRLDGTDRRWSWSLGLILVMALGLLAKLLIPGA